MGTLRSEVYSVLAEALSDPPDWLALPGSDWPLYTIAKELAVTLPNARQAVEKIKVIPSETIAVRRERYDALFSGPGRPRFWLYESLFLSGKLFGSETTEVEAIYHAAGLVTEGAELPDHASLELAFLAYVADQQAISGQQSRAWWEVERNFIKTHAGLWLPALGRELAASQDEVYAPIGQLLAGWLSCSDQPFSRGFSRPPSLWTPVLQKGEDCSLCGFCTQVCPRRVLTIRENSEETVLAWSGSSCSGCGKCVRICPVQALVLSKLNASAATSVEMIVLHSSPRAHCPKCGQPTVSQAEIECVVGELGHLPWIELCQECRLISMEGAQ